MTEPSDVHATRAAYNTVAVDYAELLRNELHAKPYDRAMLGTFAELVQSSGGETVADIGCGPGRITAHLRSLGLAAFGIDLSPEMVAVARRDHPRLQSYGHEIDLDAYRLPPDHISELLLQAGLVVEAQLLREPDDRYEKTPQAYLLARKPSTA
ncbi:class I SAM-dependent methyltransferase [Arthrobacter sp. efr-133-TYG-120]|uniref:class I SAM-dependent methyltransferase n=1 Tax=Arthrobacter sp. efr-133-TYG-120 TaxID=3040280 RepID=UPI00254EFA0B|nr:class I SAM-dependent methyltransferase [Arthrobacter sp. efr-133-TYG-120]